MSFGENQKPESRPLLRDWLSMPREELAAYVLPHKLAIMVSIDGTQRHYLLNHPETNGEISDYVAYALHNANAYVRLFNMLFELGVHTILTVNLFPPNFQRGASRLNEMVDMSRMFLTREPFLAFYEKHKVKVRLFGDYDLAQAAQTVRESLQSLDNELSVLRPDGERLLLFGYCAGAFADEEIAHTVKLYADLNRAPTAEEVRKKCFPHGPERVDIYLGAGWMRTGIILPPLLDRGATDIYILLHLALDLSDTIARTILYDHLFLRRAAFEDREGYTPDELTALAAFYNNHHDQVIGIGQLVGPGLWYPADAPALERE